MVDVDDGMLEEYNRWKYELHHAPWRIDVLATLAFFQLVIMKDERLKAMLDKFVQKYNISDINQSAFTLTLVNMKLV